MKFPSPTIEYVREDHYTFVWKDNGPDIMAGYPPRQPARVSRLFARFTPEGELLSVRVVARRLKKDGSLYQQRAYISGEEERKLHKLVREWRRER